MERFRNWRRRCAALVLLPATAIAITTASGPATAADRAGLSIDASQNRVDPNERVTFRGRVRTPQPASGTRAEQGRSPDAGRQVRVQFRANGSENWRDRERARIGSSGKFRQRLQVGRSGRFRAVAPDGRTSGTEKVRVRSKISARVTKRNPVIGERVPIKGRVAPAGSRRPVTVEVGGEKLRTTTTRSGRFRVRWKAEETGDHRVGVRAAADPIAAASGGRAGKLQVFRPAPASYYGPGFYGNRTACGQTLTTSTIGVAHKTMPCGTKLTLRYKSRELDVKVIDRGPYAGDREFDLTSRTREKLRFGSTGTILSSR